MRFQCPKCETVFEVPEDHPEDVVACEQCGTKLAIRPSEPELLDPPSEPELLDPPSEPEILDAPAAGRSRYRDRAPAADPQAVLDSMLTTVDEFWAETHYAWRSGKLAAVIGSVCAYTR